MNWLHQIFTHSHKTFKSYLNLQFDMRIAAL